MEAHDWADSEARPLEILDWTRQKVANIVHRRKQVELVVNRQAGTEYGLKAPALMHWQQVATSSADGHLLEIVPANFRSSSLVDDRLQT